MDVLVADAARCVWREGEMFDAVITDRMLYMYIAMCSLTSCVHCVLHTIMLIKLDGHSFFSSLWHQRRTTKARFKTRHS